jgi:hypothetical protein
LSTHIALTRWSHKLNPSQHTQTAGYQNLP